MSITLWLLQYQQSVGWVKRSLPIIHLLWMQSCFFCVGMMGTSLRSFAHPTVCSFNGLTIHLFA
jgi:hypothetical protein